jgi:hypothetical protein
MSDHIKNLLFVGKCLESDADSKGIGQGSEGARYCYSAATFIEKQTAELASARAENEMWLAGRNVISGHLIKRLYAQLAAEQAKNVGLRDELSRLCECLNSNGYSTNASKEILSLPSDTSALEAMIANAGEKMRDKCVAQGSCNLFWPELETAIRALPGVTLDELKDEA